MNLTERDITNTDVIYDAAGTRTKAAAVSLALSLTRFLVDILKTRPGTQIILRSPDGETQRLVMPELEHGGQETKLGAA